MTFHTDPAFRWLLHGKPLNECSKDELILGIRECMDRIRHMEELIPFVDYKKALLS